MDFSDPVAQSKLVEELRDIYGMTDNQFRQVHHRRNLPSGITAHVGYLEGVKSNLKRDHQQLGRRFDACRRYLKLGRSWPDAIRLAERDFPGARSIGN